MLLSKTACSIALKSFTFKLLKFVAISAVPALPGATNSDLHLLLLANSIAKACSLHPEPIISVFMVLFFYCFYNFSFKDLLCLFFYIFYVVYYLCFDIFL